MTAECNFASINFADAPYRANLEVDDAHRRRARGIADRLTELGPKSRRNGTRKIRSIGSQKIFRSAVVGFARFLQVNAAGNLDNFPSEAIEIYLYVRSFRVGESQFRLDHWALQLFAGRSLPWFDPKRPQVLSPRAYSAEQVEAIADLQTPSYALSTRLAFAAGLRRMELITLARLDEQARDPRPCPELVHAFREHGRLYTVWGKGGLIRTVWIPIALANELEATHRPSRVQQTYEERNLWSYFDIPNGTHWGESFIAACRRRYGKSAGAHGLRHGYVTSRLESLLTAGVPLADARAAISVEIGHFRPEIIDVYLRGNWMP